MLGLNLINQFSTVDSSPAEESYIERIRIAGKDRVYTQPWWPRYGTVIVARSPGGEMESPGDRFLSM